MTLPTTAVQTPYPYARLVRGLFYAAVGLVILYTYFVTSIILDVAGRQRATRAIADQTSATAFLEARYVDLSSGITLERARELGFQDVANFTGFAYVAPDALMVE